MELLERSEPLAELSRLLAETAAGGRIALLAGEAGAGKSTLAAAFAERVGARARLLWGACDPLLTPRPLGPVHDVARQAGGGLRELLAGGRREAVFDALLDVLHRATVLVIEDLHWADEATLDLVAFLGRRMRRCPALLVLTFRDDEIGPVHPLRTVLAGLPRPLVTRLTAAPLSVAAVTRLALAAERSPTQLYEVTGGNPLLVTEMLASTAETVPATVRELALARLGTLSPPALAVARLVSVVPGHAETALLDGRAEAVDECLGRGVLTSVANGVAYRHELLRRAVEESLSPVRRRALHTEILARLTERARAVPPRRGEPVDPARLVHHAHHAGAGEAVLRWVPVAAERAAAMGAWRQAAAHWATALHSAGQHSAEQHSAGQHSAGQHSGAALPAGERATMLEAFALAAYHGGSMIEALDARTEALALREAANDVERIGDDLRWIARLSWWNGRPDEARAAAVRAVELLETLPPGRSLAAAYINLSTLHMLADEDAEAQALGERAKELARELGDVDTELSALVTLGSVRLLRGDPSGREMLERVHLRAVEAGVDDQAGRALVNLGTLSTDHGEFAYAEPVLDRAIAFTVSRDLNGYTRHVLGHRARIRLARGDWAGALADADESLAGPEQPGGALVPALAVRGLLRSRRGDPGAEDDLRLAAEWGHRTDELQFVAPPAAALAEHHWLAGDLDRAAAEAKRGLQVAERSGHPWLLGELAFWSWRCGALVEAPAGAAVPYRLMMSGQWRAAAAEWAARGCPYQRAEALTAGDGDAIAEALRVFDGLGAVRTARRVRAGLRDRGVRVPRGPRPATAGDPAGLTARQREVLLLVADGLSNAQIAARLGVSVKTVDHHVSAVLAKLGVSSRGRAAAVLRQHG